jgi:XTP/dITP diphosphohydrolase
MYEHIKASKNFNDLVALVHILRKECPWDKKQTHESIKENLIEEAYEAVDAIEAKDYNELSKELGDLLLHVVFQSILANEHQSFTIEDVVYRIQEKLIRRHPHVFGSVKADDEKTVAENWEQLKMKEGKDSVLDGLPKHLPALIRASRMQEKVRNIGFDWEDEQGPWDKVSEELAELKEAAKSGDREATRLEFGDVLFSLVNVSRFLEVNPEDALRASNQKFERRFRKVEQWANEGDKTLKEMTLAELDVLWDRAKAEEKQAHDKA